MMKDTRYIIKRVIIGVLICLTLSFIRTCEVKALGISDFDDVTNFSALSSGLEKNTYPSITDNSSTFLYSQHDYNNLNIDLSNYKYIAIPFNSAWYFMIDRVCYWGPSNVGSNAYTAGGCSLMSNQYYTMRVWLTYSKNGVNTSQFCDYDGQLAICNVKNINTINQVHIALYYTYSSLTIGSGSMNSSTMTFKFQSRLGRSWFYMNSTATSNAIDSAIDRNIQAQEEQTDRIIESQEELNDTIKDDNIDDSSSSINEMNNKVATNSVISDLLLLPVTLFQNILNSINGTCSTWNLGSLFGTNLVLPCINLSNLLGSTLFGVIDVLLSGIFVLSIRKKFVDIFQNITSLKDGGNELE